MGAFQTKNDFIDYDEVDKLEEGYLKYRFIYNCRGRETEFNRYTKLFYSNIRSLKSSGIPVP